MKRYNIDWDKTERYEYKNGEYVFYEDHRKEIERLRENIKIATAQMARHRINDALKTLQEALKEK